MFLFFWFLQFLCKLAVFRPRGNEDYPPWHIHETDIIYNLSLNIHPSIAWFVLTRFNLVCYNSPIATYMHWLFSMIYSDKKLGSEHFYKQSDTFRNCLPPPPSLPEKAKKSSENDIFFIKNRKMSYNSTASKRAFCLEYQFGTIFCFKGASLAIESIFKWF